MDEYVLSLSYGKDSMACLGAIKELGWPLTRIVHAEIWATDTIPADLPPMVEFKKKADKWIKDNFGIDVEHVCARRPLSGAEREREREFSTKLSFERQFYQDLVSNKHGITRIYGWPFQRGPWCNSRLKTRPQDDLRKRLLSGNGGEVEEMRSNTGVAYGERQLVQQAEDGKFYNSALTQGAKKNIVQYLGIAIDETERVERHINKENIKLPLVEMGWDEAYCRQWCEEMGLLSPIYTDSERGGCWFCHNQGVDQLRLLRKKYPEYWQLMLEWDKDSPVTFKPNGRTVQDFEIRFQMEDENLYPEGKAFRWKFVDQYIASKQGIQGET